MTRLLLLLTTLFLAFAQGHADTPLPEQIDIKTTKNKKNDNGPLRAPLSVQIEAYYNAEPNTIDIIYDGVADGEVYLYFGDDIVGYDSQINTTLQVPANKGVYTIEIVTASWTAYGSIQLK